MNIVTRFSLATLSALLLLLTAASLLAYARTTVPVPALAVTTALPAVTGTLTLDDQGKTPLSVGSPVENVVFAKDTRTAADRGVAIAEEPITATRPTVDVAQDDLFFSAASADSFASPADLQIAALESGGKPPLLQGTVVEQVVYASQVPEAGSERAALQAGAVGAAAASGTNAGEINVWYGTTQKFGNIGEPQLEINVLGSVITPSGRISATYALNGGAAQLLNIGPDKRRLGRAGDFNVEINYSDLISGLNTIVVTATDNLLTTTAQSVTVTYTPSNSWPINYVANWSAAAGDIQTVAQVVDGLWGLNGATVRPIILDYDRLIAVGDVAWTDYEVVVPVTIHAIDEAGFRFPSNGPGIGLLLKWQGHFNENGEQPDIGWKNFGALGWYRWFKEINNGPTLAGMQMLGYRGNQIAINPTEVASFGTNYLMKMSVQSVTGQPAYYRFKTWLANQPEPAVWDMEAPGLKDEPLTGSLLLVAHHVDATFGNVTVRPIASITSTITTSTDGQGTILVTPKKDSYTYGETVEIVATGNSGFVLNQWGGDLSGEETPRTIKVTQDMVINATFAEAVPATVSTQVQGNGAVRISPQKALYDYDELVTLTAIAERGFQFAGWSGSLTGLQNPISVKVRQDMNVTATFEASAAPPVSDDFNRCTLDESLWTKLDPKGDSTISVNGQQLLIAVPANSDHDLFTNKNFAPRVLQPTPNTDFIVEAKFESALTARFQTQGIIIEQDSDHLLRLEFYGNTDGVHVYAAAFEGGVAKAKADTLITVPSGSPLYMRVTRTGDSWTQEYSFDGAVWLTNATFTQVLAVAHSGVYGGNADPTAGAPDTSPAHTAIIDYFFNTASRIDPEDGDALVPTISIVGEGSVTKNPEKAAYTCGETIQLTAIPEAGHEFAGWTGDVPSLTNPLSFTLNQGDDLIATFREIGTGNTTLYLPLVRR